MINQWVDSDDICPVCAYTIQTFNGQYRRCACRTNMTPHRQAAIEFHKEWYDYGIRCVKCNHLLEKHIITDDTRCGCTPAPTDDEVALDKYLTGSPLT